MAQITGLPPVTATAYPSYSWIVISEHDIRPSPVRRAGRHAFFYLNLCLPKFRDGIVEGIQRRPDRPRRDRIQSYTWLPREQGCLRPVVRNDVLQQPELSMKVAISC